MKKFLVTLLIALSFSNFAIADDAPEYIDSNLKVGNKTIWFAFNTSQDSNICIDDSVNEKECIFLCKACMIPLFQETEEIYMMPVGDKGILYQTDEFNVSYYDLKTRNEISIGRDIDEHLRQYKVPGLGYVIDDAHWAGFRDEDWNEDKSKLALKLNYYSVFADNEIRHAMICDIDIKKLSNFESDYFQCPFITDWLRGVDIDKIENNAWNDELDEVLFKEWSGDDIVLETKKGDEYRVDSETDDDLPIVPIVVLTGGFIAIFLFRKRKISSSTHYKS